MFSVFNANFQTDMGKAMVRRHLDMTGAQTVWRELSEHMRTFSIGASEKRKLTQYVTNTVLDDNLKRTTEQFVLHFNAQFRQLGEISDDSEKLPPIAFKLLSEASMILGLLKLWMNCKVPPIDMDPPHPCHIKHILIFSSMLVLGMIRPKRPREAKEGMYIIPI